MNTLKEKLKDDFMKAFKAKDMFTKNFLGVIRGEIQLKESQKDWEPTDENVLKIIKKSEKSAKENLSKGDENAERELEIVKVYLPELMSEEKVKEIVTALVGEGKSNIGLIMKEFNTTYRGKADNSLVKNLALEALN